MVKINLKGKEDTLNYQEMKKRFPNKLSEVLLSKIKWKTN